MLVLLGWNRQKDPGTAVKNGLEFVRFSFKGAVVGNESLRIAL